MDIRTTCHKFKMLRDRFPTNSRFPWQQLFFVTLTPKKWEHEIGNEENCFQEKPNLSDNNLQKS